MAGRLRAVPEDSIRSLEFVSENVASLKNLAEHVGPGDVSSADELKPGEGAVIREGKRKLAVSRDSKGRLHVHSAVCTHLGCIVHWNSTEQCWDCPCHGSHFGSDGAVLNGPAIAPLEPAELHVATKAEVSD